MKIHCFHGFLGSERDFDFLRNAFDIQSYDMNELCSGSKEAAYAKLQIAQEDVVLGYSFGARFALGAFEKYNPKALFMLAGHAGLSDEERDQRILVEDQFVHKVETLEFGEFIAYWNGLSLFKDDEPIAPKEVSKDMMVHMFREFGLSRQKNYSEVLKRNKDKVFWLCGKKDKKYYNYTKENIEPLGIECEYIDAGHRLLKKQDDVLNFVKDKLGRL